VPLSHEDVGGERVLSGVRRRRFSVLLRIERRARPAVLADVRLAGGIADLIGRRRRIGAACQRDRR